tara:strand:- start:128 stop:427 length:300 start_codon:yes stop_codon:yes gene_type:complete
MIKKILIISIILFINGCANPTTALLGPALTGAKTGSLYQASLTLGSNKVLENLKDSIDYFPKEDLKTNNSNKSTDNLIVGSVKVHRITISEVLEPEPLP